MGGLVVAAAGIPSVFALNAPSVLAVLGVLYKWDRKSTRHTLPPESFFSALRASYRDARHAPDMRLVLVRTLGFSCSAVRFGRCCR